MHFAVKARTVEGARRYSHSYAASTAMRCGIDGCIRYTLCWTLGVEGLSTGGQTAVLSAKTMQLMIFSGLAHR